MRTLHARLFLAGLAFCSGFNSPGRAQGASTSQNNIAALSSHSSPKIDPFDPSSAPAQNSAQPSQPSSGEPICGLMHLGRCLRDFGSDEKGIFTSPIRTQAKDSYWMMPLGAATGLALAYDAEAQNTLGVDQNRTNIANNIANFGSPYAVGAESAGVYFLGLAQKNPKLAETGRLSAEALLDSESVTLATKMVTNRQRPLQGNKQGDFWADGTAHWEFDSSFPSGHATAGMALARVIAGEYPQWFVAVPAYGFAEAIGISRILANQHFPSDVIVAQAIGFLTGGYVLNHHSLYRRVAKRTLAARMMTSISPLADPEAKAVGASIEIPFGQ